MPSIGLLFLEDLHSFGTWISDRAPSWARERRLDGPLLPLTITPPPVVIVVARTTTWEKFDASAPWLRLAEHVVVVLDSKDDPTLGDPELAELAALERAESSKQLDGRVTFIDSRPGELEAAIDAALRFAREVPTSRPWIAIPTREPSSATEPGPWIDWSIPERTAGSLALTDVLRLLAAGLCRPGGQPAVLDGIEGVRIALKTGRREPIAGLAGTSHPWRPIAAAPDGTQWLTAVEHTAFKLDGARPSAVLRGGSGSPIGIDPGGQLAWVGGRCMFNFQVLTEQGPAFWTPSNHDWPCGHGKKLYGYKDNDPLFVALAADASVCLSTYEHDTLLTPGLPLWWRDVGGFALAERARGEPRALLFWRADGDGGFPGDPYAAEEDARDGFVVATIGPSREARYTVSLEKPTYRLAGNRGVRLGGPDEGWIVCNATHEVVRRSSGRLLGGWGPWVVVEAAGAVHREDVATGQRTLIASVDRPIAGAIPIVGSPNVVLVNLENGRAAIRLV